MGTTEPRQIHDAVVDAFNAGDLEGLMTLYEDGARMVGIDGTTVLSGSHAIRENWSGLLALGGQMSLTTRYVIEMDDLALLSNEYVLTVGDDSVSGATAEVVRRQPDGSWRYIIDHPTGANAPPGIAT